jgi:hypothetical protein
MVPEFIFHEKGPLNVQDIQEAENIFACVKGKVIYMIGPGIILPDFITGRGKESKQDAGPGKFFTDLFHDRPALFELAEGRTVKPGQGCIRIHFPGHMFQQTFPAVDPFPCLRVENGRNQDQEIIEPDAKIIDEPHGAGFGS